MMLRALNAVALTLLVAVVALVFVTFLGRFMPGFLDPSLERVALTAWLAGLGSWWLAGATFRNVGAGSAKSGAKRPAEAKAVGMTVAFLAVATLAIAALHFFGDRLPV